VAWKDFNEFIKDSVRDEAVESMLPRPPFTISKDELRLATRMLKIMQGLKGGRRNVQQLILDSHPAPDEIAQVEFMFKLFNLARTCDKPEVEFLNQLFGRMLIIK
jgi:hypothetical protein